MHQRKSKIFLIYFILFLTIGSINNISLNSLKLDKIKTINVSGLSEKDNKTVSEEIYNLGLENIFFINKKKIDKLFSSNSLIEEYNVIKKYPSTINIRIKKTNFLAKINNEGKNYIIGSNGKLILNNQENQKLPFVFGKLDIKEFLKFKRVIDKSNFSYDQIENLYFFPSKRWDVKFNNNILLKLPKNLTEKSLNDVHKFIENYNIDKFTVIDVRIDNQIILNE